MNQVARLRTPEGDRDDPETLYDCAQAAALLGLKKSTLEKWRYRRMGPKYVRLSESRYGRVRYRKRDLEAYVKEQEHRSTSEESA